jgi:hypothetical protein
VHVPPPRQCKAYALQVALADATGGSGPLALPTQVAEQLLGMRPDELLALPLRQRTELKVCIPTSRVRSWTRAHVLRFA